MRCPSCRAPNEDDAAECFTCGSALSGATPVRQGDTIGGRYVVQARLGRGGMGTVYRARDNALEEDVALKVMAADASLDPELARRFRSEIRLARQIAHRNVCRIYEYGEEAGRRFISMELIDGTDLRRLLREGGPLPPAAAYDITIQVACGLEAIHEAGIVHRDLKSPNIMRDRQGRVKVMDFGIAKRFEGDSPSTGLTDTGHAIGTPDYMSPEQARAEKVDFRSDIYALGVVIFEVFTGALPFRAETPMAVLLKQLHEPPPIDGPAGARLPPALRPVLWRALAKRADDRHSSMGELIADLERARAAEPAGPEAAPRPPVITGAAAPAIDRLPREAPLPTPTRATPTPSQITATNVPLAPAVAARSTPDAAGARGGRRWLWAGAGLAVAAAVVLTGVGTLARTRLASAPAPAVSPPVVAAPVAVTINALPWARVRLAPAPGQTAQIPALGADDAVTPFLVLLAPGDYDVELENGGLTAPRRERLQVRAGRDNAFAFVMPGYDADAAAEAAR